MKHFRKPQKKNIQTLRDGATCVSSNEVNKVEASHPAKLQHNVVNALFNHFRRYAPHVLKTSHFSKEVDI